MGILKISAKGVDVAIAKLTQQANATIFKIDSIMNEKVKSAENNAKSQLPAQYGELIASISSEKISELKYRLIADKDYAAYVEFGTGNYAASYVNSIEPEWKELASKFIVNKQGKMKEEPYFYPAVTRMWSEILEEIKKATNARYK